MTLRKIPATKICPTIMIGDDINLSTRNFKINGRPPRKSVDCKVRFKKYVTDDNSDALLEKDYTGNKCEDITGLAYTDFSLPKYTIFLKKGDSINAKRFSIESTNQKLVKIASVAHKTATHKATFYKIKDLTICSILQEEANIFENNSIDKLREMKSQEIITQDGYIEIELK